MLSSEVAFIIKGLKQRYPERIIILFARRLDNDDRACFEESKFLTEPKIIIIHNFATSGWEKKKELEKFLDWLKLVEEDIKEWQEE